MEQNSENASAGSGSEKPSDSSSSGASESSNQNSASQNSASQSPAGQSSEAGSPSAGGGQEGGPSGQGASQPSQPSGKSGAGQKAGGAASGGGNGTAGGEGGDAGSQDAANAEYAEKTTQMVLDYLERQKEQPDPKLLEELNWTQQDLQNFVDRWSQARELSVNGDQQDRLRWQSKLEELGLRPPTKLPIAGSGINDTFQQMQDAGNRIRPPENVRKQYEAFRRALDGGL